MGKVTEMPTHDTPDSTSLELSATNLTLLQITRQEKELIDFAASAETPEELEAAKNEIDKYISLGVEKTDNIRAIYRRLKFELGVREAFYKQTKQEADLLCASVKRIERAIDLIEDRCLYVMTVFDKKKLVGRTGTLSVVGNGGKQPIVIDDPKQVPVEYCDVVVTPRIDAIREALLKGESVPGARLCERGVHLKVS